MLGLKFEEIEPENRVPLWYLTMAARVQYAKYWKQKQLPTVENRVVSLLNIIEMDKIVKRLRAQTQQEFENNWCKVKSYFENNWAVRNMLKVFEW